VLQRFFREGIGAGNGPTPMERRRDAIERDDFKASLELCDPCRACGNKHIGAAPAGHDLIITSDTGLQVVQAPPDKPKPAAPFKRGTVKPPLR